HDGPAKPLRLFLPGLVGAYALGGGRFNQTRSLPSFKITFPARSQLVRSLKLADASRSGGPAQLRQGSCHVVVVRHTGYFAIAKGEDGSAAHAEAITACGKIISDRAGLDAFTDPLRCSAVVRNDERFHRDSKVRRPSICRAQELLDLFRAAVNLICRDIFVGRIVSENRVDLLQLVKGPSGVKLEHKPANPLGRSRGTHCVQLI